MPTYHYVCSSCSNEFDQYQMFTDDALSVCPSCEGFIRRVIQPVGIVFKGSGWYLTDSRKAEKTESSAASSDTSPDAPKDKSDQQVAKPDAPKGEGSDKKLGVAPAAKSVESKPAPTTAS